MYQDTTPQAGNSYTHMWDVASTKNLEGGFSLDLTKLPSGLVELPKGTFLKADLVERTAVAIKTVKLYEALAADATVVKIVKGSLIINGDILGIGGKAIAVASLNQTNADYDSFPITANALGALSLGAILQSYNEVGTSGKSPVNPDGLCFRTKKIETETEVDVMFRADGIVVSALPYPTTDAIIASLKDCQFLNI